MKQVIGCEVEELRFCCGINEIGEFLFHNAYEDETVEDYFDTCRSGTGYQIATFVDNPQCYQAYTRLKGMYDIVFQSKPRRNYNSGREVFIVIYQEKP